MPAPRFCSTCGAPLPAPGAACGCGEPADPESASAVRVAGAPAQPAAGEAAGASRCYICGRSLPNRTALGVHIADCFRQAREQGRNDVEDPMEVVMAGYTMYMQHGGPQGSAVRAAAAMRDAPGQRPLGGAGAALPPHAPPLWPPPWGAYPYYPPPGAWPPVPYMHPQEGAAPGYPPLWPPHAMLPAPAPHAGPQQQQQQQQQPQVSAEVNQLSAELAALRRERDEEMAARRRRREQEKEEHDRRLRLSEEERRRQAAREEELLRRFSEQQRQLVTQLAEANSRAEAAARGAAQPARGPAAAADPAPRPPSSGAPAQPPAQPPAAAGVLRAARPLAAAAVAGPPPAHAPPPADPPPQAGAGADPPEGLPCGPGQLRCSRCARVMGQKAFAVHSRSCGRALEERLSPQELALREERRAEEEELQRRLAEQRRLKEDDRWTQFMVTYPRPVIDERPKTRPERSKQKASEPPWRETEDEESEVDAFFGGRAGAAAAAGRDPRGATPQQAPPPGAPQQGAPPPGASAECAKCGRRVLLSKLDRHEAACLTK